MAKVGVVVVTYHSASTIAACLASLRGACTGEMRVVVVDNASTDESAALAEAAGVTVVRRATNAGYGVGNNEGIAALDRDTDVVVLANPDTVWPVGSIDALLERLSDGIGLLSPLLVETDGTTQAFVERDLTLADALLGMTRLRKPVRPFAPSDAEPTEVDWLHTAAAILPMSVVRELGGFDERFFVFGEDADLCRRVRGFGKRVVVTPEVRVADVGGSSVAASNSADDAAALRTQALATYLEKHQGRWARRTFGAVGSVVYGLGRHRGQAREAWKAATR